MAVRDVSVAMRNVGHVFETPGGQSSVRALRNVTLDIGKGEFFSVIGPSGCGKSTLLDIVAGSFPPAKGK